MALVFLGKQHEESYLRALSKANATQSKKTIQTVLYLLTSIPSVAEKLDSAFNFHGGYVDYDYLLRNNLSNGEKILFALAINLFNGEEVEGVPMNPCQVMGQIDSSYKKVYLSALEYRYVS